MGSSRQGDAEGPRSLEGVSIRTEDEEDDQLAMEAVLKAVPAEYHIALGPRTR
jgi:hypothetical protein